MSSKYESNLLRVTGLWESKDRDGNLHLSGTLGGVTIHIFVNKFKKLGSTSPDYNLCICKRAEKPPDAKKALIDTQYIQEPEVMYDDLPF